MRLPLHEIPPEGDTPLNAYNVATAVMEAKTLAQARAGIKALVMLNRIVLNHNRMNRRSLSAPKANSKRRPILRIKRTPGTDL